MLKTFEISKLFGRYSYHIDLAEDSSCKGLLYLTGPNGMGKSTIFRMIWSLYHLRFDVFLDVPYEKVQFTFDDGYSITMVREATKEEVPIESDQRAQEFVVVHCVFRSRDRHEEVLIDWDEDNLAELLQSQESSKIRHYLNSEDCFLLSDNRLHINKADNFDNASIDKSKIAKLLTSIQQSLSDNSVTNINYSADGHVDEKRVKRVSEQLAFLHRCGLDMHQLEQMLKQLHGADLNIALNRCEAAVESCKNKLELLKSFLEMMDKASFLNTSLVLDPKYGYRFKDKDSGEFIEYTDLSSGEQQYFCQMYNLFFVVSEKRLVLIDEPEISFHMMWQMNYCKQMKTLVRYRKLNLLIATHSPEMFDGDFSLTTDLHKQNIAINKNRNGGKRS